MSKITDKDQRRELVDGLMKGIESEFSGVDIWLSYDKFTDSVLLCVSYGALYIHIGHMRFKENSTVIDAIVWLYYAIESFYGVMREEIIIKLTNSVTYVNFKKFGLQVWELRYKTT